MAGLVQIGSQLDKQAADVFGGAAGLEATRNREREMADAAEDASAMSMAGSGAGVGAMIGSAVPGVGTVAGAAAGAITGWLGSKLHKLF
jgi:phage tail tape-measure protein